MFTLIALGVGAAYAYSVIATLVPGVFPASFRTMGEVALYCLENVSEHPLAASIVGGARERNITLAEVRDFESVTGKGVSGSVDGHLVSIGSRCSCRDILEWWVG
ncbi:MAG: hypothetical protein ABR606_03990 [Vicinamibacterales bacterium]